MRILLNASNIGATGPEVLIRRLVAEMGRLAPGHEFVLLAPRDSRPEEWSLSPNVAVEVWPRGRPRELARLVDLYRNLPRRAARQPFDACLTLGDVGPIAVRVPHFVYLHTPYLVYSVEEMGRSIGPRERLARVYQRWHFRVAATSASGVIVQTPVMARRAAIAFGLPEAKISIVKPPLPELGAESGQQGGWVRGAMECGRADLRLLFLATFYAHKNHRILPELVAELRRRGLAGRVRVFLTLDGDRRRAERELLKTLEEDGDVVSNLGRLNRGEVAEALGAADALFLPTLVETFGIPYLEAMAAGKAIATSDRDFARHMCGDLAVYFEPTSAEAAAAACEELLARKEKWTQRVRDGGSAQMARVSDSWQYNASAILALMDRGRQVHP